MERFYESSDYKFLKDLYLKHLTHIDEETEDDDKFSEIGSKFKETRRYYRKVRKDIFENKNKKNEDFEIKVVNLVELTAYNFLYYDYFKQEIFKSRPPNTNENIKLFSRYFGYSSSENYIRHFDESNILTNKMVSMKKYMDDRVELKNIQKNIDQALLKSGYQKNSLSVLDIFNFLGQSTNYSDENGNIFNLMFSSLKSYFSKSDNDSSINKVLSSINLEYNINISYKIRKDGRFDVKTITLPKEESDDILLNVLLGNGDLDKAEIYDYSEEKISISNLYEVNISIFKAKRGAGLFQYKSLVDTVGFRNRDLVKYQIISADQELTENMMNNFSMHCIPYAILQKIPDIKNDVLTTISSLVVSEGMSKNSTKNLEGTLRKIANLLETKIKCRIIYDSRHYKNTNSIPTREKDKNDEIKLCVYKNHCLIDEPLKLDDELKEILNNKKVESKVFNNSSGKIKFRENKVDIIRYLQRLEELKLIVPTSSLAEAGLAEEKSHNISECNLEELQRPFKLKKINQQLTIVGAFDFESDIDGYHRGILCTGNLFEVLGNEEQVKIIKNALTEEGLLFNENDPDKYYEMFMNNESIASFSSGIQTKKSCVEMMFSFLYKVGKFCKSVLKDKEIECSLNFKIYFHNLKYDNAVISNELSTVKGLKIPVNGIVEKGSSIYGITYEYYGTNITLWDSSKMITMPLAGFKSALDLKVAKTSGVSYKFKYSTNNNMVSVEHYKNTIESEEDKNTFIDTITKEKKFNYNEEHEIFDANLYYEYYCCLDTIVLTLGLLKFRVLTDQLLEGETDKEGNQLKVDILNHMTLSSLANYMMGLLGAFDGMYETKGALRRFISEAVYGGRVIVNKETVGKILSDIQSLDGNSLYPSAMYFICCGLLKDEVKENETTTTNVNHTGSQLGFAIGKAIILTERDILRKKYLKTDYSIVKIKITNVRRKRKTPIISIKGQMKSKKEILKIFFDQFEAGIVNLDDFTEKSKEEFESVAFALYCDLEPKKNPSDVLYRDCCTALFGSDEQDAGNLYVQNIPKEGLVTTVDQVQLKEYIEYHDIEYEVIEGVYWNSGANDKMGKIAYEWYQLRVKYKKEKNPVQNIIKLLLNSSFGKTIMKQDNLRNKVIKRSKFNKSTGETEPNANIDSYIRNNSQRYKYIEHLDNGYSVIKEYTDTREDYNLSHVGCKILSVSKQIMNMVFNAVDEVNGTVYYTDTDCIHVDNEITDKISDKFEELYGFKMEGSTLGRFSIDFEIAKTVKIQNKIIGGFTFDSVARKAIYCGKKLYYASLEADISNKDLEVEVINDNGKEFVHAKDLKVVTGNLCKSKGISKGGLQEHCKLYHKNNYLEMYQHINKFGCESNIFQSSKPRFVHTYLTGVQTLPTITRKIGNFKYDIECDCANESRKIKKKGISVYSTR